MGKDNEQSTQKTEDIQLYSGPELNFLSSEYLRQEFDNTFKAIPEYREACVSRIATGEEAKTISFESGWSRFDVTRSLQGASKSIHVVKTTLAYQVDILLASNPQTKNGAFMYAKKTLYQNGNTHEEESKSKSNSPQAFFEIVKEIEDIEGLAFTS
jgi:hypothetical protein